MEGGGSRIRSYNFTLLSSSPSSITFFLAVYIFFKGQTVSAVLIKETISGKIVLELSDFKKYTLYYFEYRLCKRNPSYDHKGKDSRDTSRRLSTLAIGLGSFDSIPTKHGV